MIMKIKIEIVEPQEEEIILRVSELNETTKRIQQAISEITSGNNTLALYKNEIRYYIELNQILFFETTTSGVCAHTAKEVFETKSKLFELEEILPGSFMRVAKSTILNTNHIYSIKRNLTASSEVEFKNTHKKVFVSRNYYKALIEKLEEKRFK